MSHEEEKSQQASPLNRVSSEEKVEHVSDIIGSWGPLQRRSFLLLAIVYCVAPFNNVSLLYYVIKSDLWCEQADGSKIFYSPEKCSFSVLDKCTAWGHNTTRNTLTKEWDLVCERYWLRSLAQSAYQIGYLFSGLLVGYISDKYGRKFAIICCIILEIICETGLVFSSSVYMFIGIRIIHGIGGYGRFLASLILLVESVGPQYRSQMVVNFDWIWYGGEYFMILVTFLVQDFRHIYLGTCVFQFASLYIMSKVPESPRWQLISGRSDEAEKTLRKYAVNTGLVKESAFTVKFDQLCGHLFGDKTKQGFKSNKTLFHVLKVPILRKYCIALYAIWYLNALIAFGLHYTTLDLSGNIFVNNSIFAISGVSSIAFLSWKVESFRRRIMLIVFFISTSTVLFLSIPFAHSTQNTVIRTILFTTGKFFSSCLFCLLYVYSPELFPTSIRHLAVGSCSVAARVASISAPFVAQLTAYTDLTVTFGLFATLGLIGAVIAIVLPETKGKEIPDTVEDMIEMNPETE